jgi:hypothetical protein
MLTILLARCESTRDALDAADNPIRSAEFSEALDQLDGRARMTSAG